MPFNPKNTTKTTQVWPGVYVYDEDRRAQNVKKLKRERAIRAERDMEAACVTR